MSDLMTHVHTLAAKAAEDAGKDEGYVSMRLSQAALNIANAARVAHDMRGCTPPSKTAE